MIKTAILYRLFRPIAASAEQVEQQLQVEAFTPCSPSKDWSSGWMPPRGHDHGPLLESVGGQWILKLMTETKRVPTEVLNRAVAAAANEIETTTGRKPGKKERRDLKETALLALLPAAFPVRSVTTVWIDPATRLVAVDASSQVKADDALRALVSTVQSLVIYPVNTKTSATAAMSDWLANQEAPAGFTIDRECELTAADESKAVVKYGRHPLDIEEVRAHVEGGKLPTKLAMTWDGRVSFVLTDSMHLKKLSFLDVVFEGGSEDQPDGFDADTAILTGELSRLVPDLLEALGGEVVAPGIEEDQP